MSTDLTQTKEALAVLTALADAIKAAKADGTINWLDLPRLAPVIVAVRAAVDQADKIPGEVTAALADPQGLSDLISDVMSVALALADSVLTK